MHQFIKPLYARLVRIIALAWHDIPSMRLELYGCGKVIQRFIIFYLFWMEVLLLILERDVNSLKG